MNKIPNLKDVFEATAAEINMTREAVEKDYWICWVLEKIFSDETLNKVLRFKGGTSLSKCFNVIERFSEDIDLILDWNELTNENPEDTRSKTKQDKFNKDLNAKAEDYIENNILNKLNQLFKGICSASIDEENKQNIHIKYTSNFESGYLRNFVMLEIGPLAAMIPFSMQKVASYAQIQFPDKVSASSFEVPTIDAERTFWEKATILHAEAHRPQKKVIPGRYSRHYYDMYKLYLSDIKDSALKNIDLLLQVREFKQKFYPLAWAKYDLAVPGTFKLLPREATVSPDPLVKDYNDMSEMIFGEIPKWSEVLSGLKELEKNINNLK